MDCHSEFTCSDRTKRRRIKATVEKHVRAIAVDIQPKSDDDDVTAEVPGDCSTILPPFSDLFNVPGATNCQNYSLASPTATTDGVSIGSPDTCDDVFDDSYANTDSEADEEDVEFDASDARSIRSRLAEWAVTYNVSHVAISTLLTILRENNIDVPKDPRTLLSTPKTTAIKWIAGGSYHHRGIAHAIICAARNKLHDIKSECELTLDINIDGLPLFKSSNVQLWPILGLIRELKKIGPFLIGLFSGSSKPTSVDDFLSDFVKEMKFLGLNGLDIDERHFSVTLGAIVCDAPARAYLKCIKGHSGYNSCERCVQEGVYAKGRMTFPELIARERTDKDFDCRASEDHHTGVSPFSQLGIGCVTQFPLDYMHLVCLGIVRRLVLLWMKGPLSCRLRTSSVKSISGELLLLLPYMPKEFCRKPRSLSEVMHWKATEFRQFLLYSGPAALHSNLKDSVYRNFMVLSVAMTILLSPRLCVNYCDYAKQLLNVFVQNFISIYGSEFVSYNVHSLLHLADDAKKFGALDGISAFPFESYLGRLKGMVRRSQNPVSQVVRRIDEMQDFQANSRSVASSSCKKPHHAGPLPPCMPPCSQYRQYWTNVRLISCLPGDNCFEIDGNVCVVKNVLLLPSGAVTIVYDQFTNVRPFYEYPLNSLSLGISLSSHLSGKLKVIDAGAVGKKCIMLPFKEAFLIMPLLHL
jgi:hypothetical protein